MKFLCTVKPTTWPEIEHMLFLKCKCKTLYLKFNKINVTSPVLVFLIKWA